MVGNIGNKRGSLVQQIILAAKKEVAIRETDGDSILFS